MHIVEITGTAFNVDHQYLTNFMRMMSLHKNEEIFLVQNPNPGLTEI
jgi:hypothetical protein